MKKLKFVNTILIVFLFSGLISCNSCRRPNVNPGNPSETTDLLNGKTFGAVEVKEKGAIVYRKGVTGNIIPGYQGFRLRLETDARPAKVASLTECTGETFNGRWEVVDDGQGKRVLRLTSLVPAPTNSNGVMEYEIRASTSETLSLVSVKPNLKTGNSVNEYLLGKL